MAVVSDASILSSLVAADALGLLPKAFANDDIYIPPTVELELQAGLERGKTYLEQIFQSIQAGDIQVLSLTQVEQELVAILPHRLHTGEREGIALCQKRGHLFLCNDKRAVRYCQINGIDVINLEAFLRLLWLHRIISQDRVKSLIEKMEMVENLTLNQSQRAKIFAPRSSKA